MSFFCFEAGRISSRSTGTPNETKNSRRIRERTQFGGCKGGGATSCDHRERLRSVRKIEYLSGVEYGGPGFCVVGKSSSRYGSLAVIMSSKESSLVKSSSGFNKLQHQLSVQNKKTKNCGNR